jgi:hypothetical protein
LNSGKLEKTILKIPLIVGIHGIHRIFRNCGFRGILGFAEFRSSKILAIPGFPQIFRFSDFSDFQIWRIKSWNLETKFLKSREFQEFLKKSNSINIFYFKS